MSFDRGFLRIEASRYHGSHHRISTRGVGSGDDTLIEAALANIEKVARARPIKTKAEYDRSVMVLNALLDAGGADEKHRLATLANSLGEFISEYERAHGL